MRTYLNEGNKHTANYKCFCSRQTSVSTSPHYKGAIGFGKLKPYLAAQRPSGGAAPAFFIYLESSVKWNVEKDPFGGPPPLPPPAACEERRGSEITARFVTAKRQSPRHHWARVCLFAVTNRAGSGESRLSSKVSCGGQAKLKPLCVCVCSTAVCMFGGRELVEGDQKAVHDSSGRCLLFECRVSYARAHTDTRTDLCLGGLS